MCGIGGVSLISGTKLDIPMILSGMKRIQHHRGPDGQGQWWDDRRAVGLCHNRLAILDLSSAGAQPMHSEDGRFIIVFNGELYNYQELREQLKGKGATFRSECDTEVLLEAYRIWGEEMLPLVRGMFALTLYDSQEDIMFCARDRLGEKPFVYAETAQGFAFASEIPALCVMPGIDTNFDHPALAAMMLHNMRHIPDPYSAYKGVRRLKSGHALRVRSGRIERLWRYWNPQPAEEEVTSERLRWLLEDAVRLQLQSDVPVGALLSGGVDSSAIVALMQKYARDPVRTYALGLDANDEDLRRARVMATHLGTEHREFYFDPDEQWRIFNNLLSNYGEPIMLLPLVHAYALCNAIRSDGIKVVLSGNGADELFYGYTGHTRTLRVSRWLDRTALLQPLLAPFLPGSLGWVTAPKGRRKSAYYAGLAQMEWARYLMPGVRPHLANRAAEQMAYWGQISPSSAFIDESNFIGLMVENTHSVTIASDLSGMAASIEVRAPFLDQEIVSFAMATQAQRKIPDPKNPNWLKAILREAVADIVPADLLRASKRGFGMGIQEDMLLRGPWRIHAERVFREPHDAGGLFDPFAVQAIWKNFIAGGEPASRVAKLFAIQVWLKNVVLGA